jgi:hypothetical protein
MASAIGSGVAARLQRVHFTTLERATHENLDPPVRLHSRLGIVGRNGLARTARHYLELVNRHLPELLQPPR